MSKTIHAKFHVDAISRLVALCLVITALVICFSAAVHAESGGVQIKIAALALRGPAEVHQTWDTTARYLSGKIPGYSFTIVPYDFKTISPAAQRGEFDFVIANSSIYVELESLYGVTRIATLKGLSPGRTATLFGGVIFCRQNRSDINDLRDIRHKSFMATEENSFGGWRMAWREFHTADINPYTDFKSMEFAGTHDGVVYAVRDGKVDAGSVRTGILESMAKEGKIRLEDFKIINQKYDEQFSYIHSTRLYPEWPFSRLRHTDDALAQKVVLALLSMPSDGAAAKAAKSAGWTTPHDYADVHELFKELKIGPYKQYGQITLAMVLDKYRYPVAISLTFIMILALFAGFMMKLNDRLTRSNIQLEVAHNDLKEAQSQLLQREKMASVGQLAAGIAHEINNPIGFILSNLTTMKKYHKRLEEFIDIQSKTLARLPSTETALVSEKKRELKIERIIPDICDLIEESHEGSERIRNIVKDLKNFSHIDEAEIKLTDINANIESTINIVWNEYKYKAEVVKEFSEVPRIECNPGQINQVILNILINAAHSIYEHGIITIRTWADDELLYISIADTGHGIPPEIIGRLFEPFFTTKEVGKGTGLGLSIAYDIVKKHHGEITVESEVGKGSCFTIKLPLQQALIQYASDLELKLH